jgi:hypothetical protein
MFEVRGIGHRVSGLGFRGIWTEDLRLQVGFWV